MSRCARALPRPDTPPCAARVQHNNLHHYHLSEGTDPDLVERNLAVLRRADAPWPVKWMSVLALAGVWKWFYYAVRYPVQQRSHTG